MEDVQLRDEIHRKQILRDLGQLLKNQNFIKVYRNQKCTLKSTPTIGASGKTIERIDGPTIDGDTREKIKSDECLDMDGIVCPGLRSLK